MTHATCSGACGPQVSGQSEAAPFRIKSPAFLDDSESPTPIDGAKSEPPVERAPFAPARPNPLEISANDVEGLDVKLTGGSVIRVKDPVRFVAEMQERLREDIPTKQQCLAVYESLRLAGVSEEALSPLTMTQLVAVRNAVCSWVAAMGKD